MVLILSSVGIITLNHRNNVNNTLDLSRSLIKQISLTTYNKLENFLLPVARIVASTAETHQDSLVHFLTDAKLEQYALQVMKFFPQAASFNYGDTAGNFFMLKRNKGNLDTKIINRRLKTPKVTWKHRASDGSIISKIDQNQARYDPRNSTWYNGAKQERKLFWSESYIFFTSQAPGITIGAPVVDRKGNFRGGRFFGCIGHQPRLSKKASLRSNCQDFG